MSCHDLPSDPNYAVGGTFADGVGSGACSDTAEVAFYCLAGALTVLAAATAWLSNSETACLLGLPAAAAAALFFESVGRLVFLAPVLVQHRRAPAWQSRQIGVPATVAVLSFLYSAGLHHGGGPTSGGSCSRLEHCACIKVIDVVNGLYVSAAIGAAVWHPASATAWEYQSFDWAGVALACGWWVLTVVAVRNTGGGMTRIFRLVCGDKDN